MTMHIPMSSADISEAAAAQVRVWFKETFLDALPT